MPNDHASARDQLKKKFFLQFNKDAFEFWARYTNGGTFLTTNRNTLEASAASLADPEKFTSVAYQQISSSASYNYELNSDWDFDFSQKLYLQMGLMVYWLLLVATSKWEHPN